VRARPLFFPGVELPQNGWYAQRQTRAGIFRPMSRCASQTVESGRLSIRHTNCYPKLGATDIHVSLNGRELARLSTLQTDETALDAEDNGDLQFTAHRIFEAEQTGEQFDIGGWIAVEPQNKVDPDETSDKAP
jgi:hypothetical protein